MSTVRPGPEVPVRVARACMEVNSTRFLQTVTQSLVHLPVARFRSLVFLFTTLLIVATCAPCSPGLLVCLHLVSIFSDLLFRTLQVSGLHSIYPGSIPVCEENFPFLPSKLWSAIRTSGHTRVLQSRFIGSETTTLVRIDIPDELCSDNGRRTKRKPHS